MVTFSVYKSSKYLFDCVGTTDSIPSTSPAAPYSADNLNALEALCVNSLDVVKRMDYAELDKLIACCKEQLIQVIVAPATHGDIGAFQKFAKYLKTRHRAGVALLPDGRLLVLAPFEKNDLRLRCVVIKAKPTAAASAALPSKATAKSLDGTESAHIVQTRYDCQADIALPPPEPEPRCEIRQHGRIRSSSNNCVQKQDIADNLCNGSPPGLKSNNQTNRNVVLLSGLPRIERATKIAQLRHEYEQFHENYYKILQEWSELNSN